MSELRPGTGPVGRGDGERSLSEFRCRQCGWVDSRPDKCTNCGSLREASRSLRQDVDVPDYLHAHNDSDWHYYVRDTGDLEDSFGPIGEPDEFVYERVWLRPIPASAVDPEERDEDEETVTRGKDGRFKPVYFWIEASPVTYPDAVAFYGARYV